MPDGTETPINWQAARDRGAALIDEGKYADAVAALTEAAPHDPLGDCEALLGLAYFQQEDYGNAAEHYHLALNLSPRDEGSPAREQWREMLDLARLNAEAAVNVHVPPVHHHTREELLAAPLVPPGTLPAPPRPAAPGLRARILRPLGSGLGAVVSVVMNAVTHAAGRTFGYKDAVWTNWYRRNLVLGILTLAYMRERLNKHNLKSTYPPGVLIGFQDAGLVPPAGVTHFRTADGSWNNMENPKEGAAGTRFPRNVEESAIRPETGDALMSPNPREISRKLLTREGEMKQVPFLNMLAASWINFQNHDWVSHGENLAREIHEIPLSDDDPARRKYRQRAMFVAKTQPDVTRMPSGETVPISFINEVTHWWDGSQIYGSDQATVDRLRSHEGGKLRLNRDGTLPVDERGIEETGFTRNWWVGLTMLHTLFASEHNAICDALAAANPGWDDNRLFNVARLVNAAIMAKIHSVEWTPAILPNPGLNDALNANWYGLLTNLFKRGSAKKTLANFNIANPELGGVVGNPINKHGVPYGLTQEFVEVYRLHSLLPEQIEVKSHVNGETIQDVPFVRVRQAGSARLTASVGLADLFYSFGNQQPGQLVLNNFPAFMQNLSIPGNPLFDMGAVDILRARERGVPRYNEFRRQLGLNPIRRFEDLTRDAVQVQRLKEVYGDRPEDVERLDLLVGTLAEGTRPTGFGFGETMFQIFILNATRRLQADRFFTDNYNEETYTKEGLAWIDRADLKTVILRHYPELASTGLGNVKNAFEPWDTAERLDPARHPLRGYDRELKADPWRGDAGKGK